MLDKFLEDPNVVGYAMSKYKERRGVRYVLDEVLVFFVKKKLPPFLVPREFFIPPKITVGGKEYITDVIEVGTVDARPTTVRGVQTARFRPVPYGVSAAAATASACTLTGPFEKDGVVYFLTCAHCVGRIEVSCEISYNLNNPILQPSPLDGGRMSDVIGRVAWSSDLTRRRIDMDLAYIFPEAYVSFDSEVASLGIYLNGKMINPSLHDVGIELYKSGRSTGFTSGKLYGVNGVVKTNYGACGEAIVDGVLVFEKMIERGDSGAPVFSLDGTFYGVMFATSQTHSFAIPAGKVVGLGLKPLSTKVGRLNTRFAV